MTTARLRAHLKALSDPSSIDPAVTFAIRVDNREQDGWSWAPSIPTVGGTLKSGDYAPFGYETEAAIERKALGDLVSSMTWGNDRFQRELERLSTFKLAAVVIEGSPYDVESHRYFAKKVEPAEVFALMATLHVKFNVPFIFGGQRKHAAGITARLLAAYWRQRRSEEQAVATKNLEAAILAKGAP